MAASAATAETAAPSEIADEQKQKKSVVVRIPAFEVPPPMPPTVAAAIAADVMTRAQLSSGFGRTQCRWFPPPELRSSKRNLALYECVPPRTDSFAFLCPREVANRRWERTEDVLFPFVLMRSEFAARLQNALLAAGIYWLKTGTARPKAISAGLHKNNPRYSQVPFKVAALPCGYGPPKRRKGTWIIVDSLVWQSEPAWVKDVRADYLQRLSDFPGPRADGGAGLVDFKPPPEKRPRMAVANLIS